MFALIQSEKPASNKGKTAGNQAGINLIPTRPEAE